MPDAFLSRAHIPCSVKASQQNIPRDGDAKGGTPKKNGEVAVAAAAALARSVRPSACRGRPRWRRRRMRRPPLSHVFVMIKPQRRAAALATDRPTAGPAIWKNLP